MLSLFRSQGSCYCRTFGMWCWMRRTRCYVTTLWMISRPYLSLYRCRCYRSCSDRCTSCQVWFTMFEIVSLCVYVCACVRVCVCVLCRLRWPVKILDPCSLRCVQPLQASSFCPSPSSCFRYVYALFVLYDCADLNGPSFVLSSLSAGNW